MVACLQRASARRPSRSGAAHVVTVRPHVHETKRNLLLKLADDTRGALATSNSTLQGCGITTVIRLLPSPRMRDQRRDDTRAGGNDVFVAVELPLRFVYQKNQ